MKNIYLLIALLIFGGCATSSNEIVPGGSVVKVDNAPSNAKKIPIKVKIKKQVIVRKIIQKVEVPVEVIKEVIKEVPVISEKPYLKLKVRTCRVRNMDGKIVGYYENFFPKIYEYEKIGNKYKISDNAFLYENCIEEVNTLKKDSTIIDTEVSSDEEIKSALAG